MHESLFRVWKKLAAWLTESRELLLWKKRIQNDVEDWQKSGILLRDARLVEAERWAKKNPDELAAPVLMLVGASVKAREQELREERDRQQRELEVARRMEPIWQQ